jgi:hypothetical protein
MLPPCVAKDGSICRTPIASIIAQVRQQVPRRSFSANTSKYAKHNKIRSPSRRESPRPPISSKPPSSINAKSVASSKATQGPASALGIQALKAEKAQVQLSQLQVASILGPGLTFDQGMEILQEIQYRRVTGSLADKGIVFDERPEFSQDHRLRALEWLRDNYPVDEEAAAAEYAEEIAEELQKDLEERAKNLRLYKRDDAEVEEGREDEVVVDEQYDKIPLREDQTRDITGESALQARKQYVEASRKKAKIEAEKAAEEMEARGEKPPEPYKGHDLVVARKTAIGMSLSNRSF